ncbi:MAG: DUF6073 family protein [Myxococcota bacterium]|nr:DUF6073 family protein [Myxococcota bacterium]
MQGHVLESGRNSLRTRRLELGRTRVYWTCLAALASLTVCATATAQSFPPAGLDSFPSSMELELDFPEFGKQVIQLEGPVTILRGAPRKDGDIDVIDTEIVAMDLRGEFLGGAVVVRVNPETSSVGEVRAQTADAAFPADSFFDVFIEIELIQLETTLINLDPVTVQVFDLMKLPPLFDTYTHPIGGIQLVVLGTVGPVVAIISGESTHDPEQDPTFSLAAGGSRDPAAGLGLPTPPTDEMLTVAGLGLRNGDDMNALSFGTDIIDDPDHTGGLAFSVDPTAIGKPSSGVFQESSTDTEQGAEFITYVDANNLLLIKDNLLVPVPGPAPSADDLDALNNFPASAVDFGGDGIPELPVFYSLAPLSPTLIALAASAADVLVTTGAGAVASVFASAADIGLQVGDDIDAMCLMKSAYPSPVLRPGPGGASQMPPIGPLLSDFMIFSLAAGSPTLASLPASPGDLFVTNFSNSMPGFAAQPLQVYASADDIGLIDSDELNALKCLALTVIVEIDPLGDFNPLNQQEGCGDDSVLTAIRFNPGIAELDASGDPFTTCNDTSDITNPQVGDHHGPYACPNSLAAEGNFFPEVDPTLLNWVGNPGDNCGFMHIHGFFGEDSDEFGFHADPDPESCGHGIFSQASHSIETFDGPRSQAEDFIDLVTATFNQDNLDNPSGVFATNHLYNGESTIDDLGCESSGDSNVVIFTGMGRTNFSLILQGAGGGNEANLKSSKLTTRSDLSNFRVGEPQSSFDVPLLAPEPNSSLLGVSALVYLTWLARRRARC